MLHAVLPTCCMYIVCVSCVCFADSIEANVETADVHVQNATQQLSRAADYQVKLDRMETEVKRREERRGIHMYKC